MENILPKMHIVQWSNDKTRLQIKCINTLGKTLGMKFLTSVFKIKTKKLSILRHQGYDVPGHQDFDVPPDLTGHSKFGRAPKF